MIPKAYFMFHYQRDIWRVNQVRNSHVVEGVAAAGFKDGSLWEESKKKGEAIIKKMIDDALAPTDVAVLLIGSKTADREYVEYEIKQARKLKKPVIGIFIHQLEDQYGKEDTKGENPLTKFRIFGIKTYDWVRDNGYENFGKWIKEALEEARSKTGRRAGALAGAAIGAFGGPVVAGIGALIGYAIGDEFDNDEDADDK